MNKNAPYTLNIDMSLSEDMDTCICICKCITTVKSETVLAALLASAVVAIAHDHSCAPHKFAEAMCGMIMAFIDNPGFTKSKEQLS